jgi:hypothetical protein
MLIVNQATEVPHEWYPGHCTGGARREIIGYYVSFGLTAHYYVLMKSLDCYIPNLEYSLSLLVLPVFLGQ